jgi:hypothetical protein
LARCLKLEPKKPQIMAIVSIFGASEVRAARKATAELNWKVCLWMRRATAIEFLAAEFHGLADLFLRGEAFDVLGDFALAAKRREPKEPVWRFYEIVARTMNNPDWIYFGETDELVEMANNAAKQKDHQWVNRIRRYMEGLGDDPAAKRRARRLAAAAEASDEEELEDALEAIFKSVSPQDVQRLMKKHGKVNAVAVLVDTLANSPVGALLPRPQLASMARTMVDMVLDNGRSYF